MRILIAEDEPTSRRLLEVTLQRMGHEVTAVADGAQAWERLQQADTPRLAILDWMMPGLEGPEVCRRVRALERPGYTYLLLLTTRSQRDDVVAGLEAGADDYLVKPWDRDELRWRLLAGERVLDLETTLDNKIGELEEALAHVKQLQGLLPICMYCKNIRDDKDVWHRMETYLESHSEASFTHSLCNDCLVKHYPESKLHGGSENVGSR